MVPQLGALCLELRQLGLAHVPGAMIAAPGEQAVGPGDRMAGEGADDEQRQRRHAARRISPKLLLGRPLMSPKESRKTS